MEVIIMVFIFVIGICIGSFLNVVGLRIPKKESIVFPASHCVNCNYSLKPYDLIPIFSYLFLKGKCRKCDSRISIKYPLIELLTGLVFLFIYANSDSTLTLVFHLLLMSVMIALTVSDIEYQLVPNKILLYTFIVLVPLGIYSSENTIFDHLLGGLIFFGGLLLLAIITKGGMGGGDIKLLSLLGFSLGLNETVLVFMIACLIGAIVGLFLKIFVKGLKVLPFVPFICVGVLITIVYYAPIWAFIFYR